jgi:hypothetical protein
MTLEKVLSTLDLSEEVKKELTDIFNESVKEYAKKMVAEAPQTPESSEGESATSKEKGPLFDEMMKNFEELMNNQLFKRLLMVWDRKNPDVTRAELIRSFPAAFRDLQGNALAEPLLAFFMDVIKNLMSDTGLASRFISKFQTVSEADELFLDESEDEDEDEEIDDEELDDEAVKAEVQKLLAKLEKDWTTPRGRKVVSKLKKMTEMETDKNEMEFDEDNLVEQLDRYINYFVEEFMKENKIAIESGVKVELAESFLKNMKSLIEQHDVNFSSDEEPILVKKLQEKLAEKEEATRELYEKNIQLYNEMKKLNEEVKLQKKERIFESLTKNLPLTQVERLRKLEQAINYDNLREYNAKLKTLIETVTETPVDSKMILTEEELGSNESVTNPIDKSQESVDKYLKYF